MSDHRERALYPDWGVEVDLKREKLRIFNQEANELVERDAEFTICPDCQGRGSYVNPAIDSHGLSREDFDEDPDFREDYMSGRYDIQCRTCQGLRVILTPADDAGKTDLAAVLRAEADSRAECEAERRMGA